MMIYVCDRCKVKMIEAHFHMTFSGNVAVDLCPKCEASFREWLKNRKEEYDRVNDDAESEDDANGKDT